MLHRPDPDPGKTQSLDDYQIIINFIPRNKSNICLTRLLSLWEFVPCEQLTTLGEKRPKVMGQIIKHSSAAIECIKSFDISFDELTKPSIEPLLDGYDLEAFLLNVDTVKTLHNIYKITPKKFLSLRDNNDCGVSACLSNPQGLICLLRQPNIRFSSIEKIAKMNQSALRSILSNYYSVLSMMKQYNTPFSFFVNIVENHKKCVDLEAFLSNPTLVNNIAKYDVFYKDEPLLMLTSKSALAHIFHNLHAHLIIKVAKSNKFFELLKLVGSGEIGFIKDEAIDKARLLDAGFAI